MQQTIEQRADRSGIAEHPKRHSGVTKRELPSPTCRSDKTDSANNYQAAPSSAAQPSSRRKGSPDSAKSPRSCSSSFLSAQEFHARAAGCPCHLLRQSAPERECT